MCAASVLLREMRWSSENGEIGLISGSPDGCLRDNQEYFSDYVRSGRTLGFAPAISLSDTLPRPASRVRLPLPFR